MVRETSAAVVVYGDKIVKVEPFGVEPIPEQERHGRPGVPGRIAWQPAP
ncbi:MAG: hypothetical protein Q8P59_06530 [Dehalococcoidia bacterium]|nr:hypothetical protein [Dehalococcoidia bacterium]